MARACLVLPPRARFADEAVPSLVSRALGRADAVDTPGGIESLFDVLPRGWPAAAVTRELECGDAGNALWLRADPAYVRPDINGARLLAIGEMLGLGVEEADALLTPLKPLFGDFGMPIEAGTPSSWHVRLQPGTPLPTFVAADDALGADLFDNLPPGTEGRRFRALLSEAQVVLHQHPLNERRRARGLVPVNSLWFWGAGALPDRVATAWSAVQSPDATVRAFATRAGADARPLQAWRTPERDVAIDLRHERELERLCDIWIRPALDDVAARRLASLSLRWADGMEHLIRRSQRLRFWRRPLHLLAHGDTA